MILYKFDRTYYQQSINQSFMDNPEKASQFIYFSEALRIKLHDATAHQISNQTPEQKS